MANLGSSTNPSFAGWIYRGTDSDFGAKYALPSSDILVLEIHVYFDTIFGSGAHGWLCIWDNGGAQLYTKDIGVINNGTEQAGGQQWWSHTLSAGEKFVIPASKGHIWIGGYCNQSTLFSTYDTSPHAFYEKVGTGGGPGGMGTATDSGQGPIGGYIVYSPVVYSGAVAMGSNGGGMLATADVASKTSGLVTMGGSGGLFAQQQVPQLRIWRLH